MKLVIAVVVLIAGLAVTVAIFLPGGEVWDSNSPDAQFNDARNKTISPPTGTDELLVSEPTRSEPAVVSSSVEARASFACDLKDLSSVKTFLSEEHTTRMENAALALSTSGSAELVLAAALLSEIYSKDSVARYTDMALQLDAEHPLVLWQAAELCARQVDLAACNDPTFSARLAKTHGNNGAYWAMVANEQLRKGNTDRALDNLARASTAAVLDFQVTEHVLLLERGLAAASDMSYPERVTTAIGVAPLSGDHDDLYRNCRERAETDALWAQACFDYGRRLSNESDTVIFRMIGYVMQRKILESWERTEDVNSVSKQIQALRDAMRNSADDRALLMLVDHRFTAQFVDEMASNGEIAALEFSDTEIMRLRSNPDYNPCELDEFQADVVESQ